MIVRKLRRSLHQLLRDDEVTSWLEQLVGISIVSSLVIAILATEPLIRSQYMPLMRQLDQALAALFALEYLTRLWVAPLEPGQMRGLGTPAASQRRRQRQLGQVKAGANT